MELYLGVYALGLISGVLLTLWVKGISFNKPKKITHRPSKPKKRKQFHIGWR